MIRRLALIPLLLAAGCLISQPITVTYPADAAWTFAYRDALGEPLGGGRATVRFSDDGAGLRVDLTEEAFGDRARLEGRLLRQPTEDDPWAPFTAEGRWFTGEAFVFSGCVNRAAGRIAPGAAAYLAAQRAMFQGHPLIKDPCRRDKPVKRFAEEQVDRVFTWGAELARR